MRDRSPDALLLRAIADGDADALAQLYDRWSAQVFGLALRITRAKADAEDVVIDTFIDVWRDAERFDVDRWSVPAWLATIARRRALDCVGSAERRPRFDDARSAGTPTGRAVDPPRSHVEDDARARRVRDAIDALPAPQRAALELAYFDGLSGGEIAERLAEPLDTAKTRVRLGLRRLRELLAPLGPLEAS